MKTIDPAEPSGVSPEREPKDAITESERRISEIKTGALQDAIFNSAYFSSIATDEKGVIQIFNVGAERMLGFSAEDVVNKITPADISDPQELIARAEALSQELGTSISPGFEALIYKASRGIEDSYELTYVRKDGSRFPAMVSVTALRDADQKIIGYLLIGTDNTARKRWDSTLQEKNAELERASRMKSEFLATMSHELRTPLNAIIGFSEALKDGLVGKLSKSQREYISDIFTSGQHLLSLINDILDLSKVEAGMMELELEPVDLNSLLSNSLSIVKEKAAAHNLTLALDVGEDLGVPKLDMRKTKQIVYNLLSNAVKFSLPGAFITLGARRVGRAAVGKLPGEWAVQGFELADNEYDDFLEICVSDTGIGISVADMGKLFQAFSQIDSSLARQFEGTGLGLAMVKQLAELHGGTVAVASAEGQGARFAAWLPLRVTTTEDEQQKADILASTISEQADERVALVVESDQRAADLLRMLLENEGFTVLHAESAEAALVLAPQQRLTLITLDLILPGMDGWEFLQRISESKDLARVPVVVIAGEADGNIVLAGGASVVMHKPISRVHLQMSLAGLGLQPDEKKTHTILVVDDDPTAVEVIAAFLPTPTYAVVRAYGGAEAITLAKRLRPDLILLDLMMPQVSGFDVVEALHRNPATAQIAILVVTAKTITATDRAALSSNPDQVIKIVEKSGFSQARFIAEVRRALLFSK